MKRSPVLLVILWLVGAWVLAFPLRSAVERLVVEPLVYMLWMLGILYRAIPQPVVWLVVLLIMFYVALGSFYGKPRQGVGRIAKSPPTRGPLESLSLLLAQKTPGVYFKWQIGRTLGEIALDLQELREHARSRDLHFADETPPEVQRYLDAGLNTSFADYPYEGGLPILGWFHRAPKTPFDMGPESVVAYLESQMESQNDSRRS
jgi:hypothetical protein